MTKAKDEFTRSWITRHSLDICEQYDHGVLTLRALHYQLVGLGMTNTVQHYKRVVGAMIKARREGIIAYSQFSDHDRESLGVTEATPTDLEESIEEAKQSIEHWMNYYWKNDWENQPIYPEVWIEKKALQGVFRKVCRDHHVSLNPCKGYPSLTFLYEASRRFHAAVNRGQGPKILYFGDHDPSGEDIPRSIRDNLYCDFGVEVDVEVIGLTESQCLEMNLPAAPAKSTDSRSKHFDGLGQIELDAVPPETLRTWADDAIRRQINEEARKELKAQESDEREEYVSALREHVESL